ncbi:hypothetical protein AB6802_16315 [Mesorhizobium sp. RCC_202]|uniref:hypothetical protein n=1 Tax=Mesorhizobium sp. RCC_202 TaxID=3239222 RepID=UPI003523F25E
MTTTQNNRETGATKYPAREGRDPTAEFSQDAAENKKPKDGLSRPPGEVDDKTHQSDGQNPPRAATPSPATQRVAGAGPAIAERSKDAGMPRDGRQPGENSKD